MKANEALQLLADEQREQLSDAVEALPRTYYGSDVYSIEELAVLTHTIDTLVTCALERARQGS